MFEELTKMRKLHENEYENLSHIRTFTWRTVHSTHFHLTSQVLRCDLKTSHKWHGKSSEWKNRDENKMKLMMMKRVSRTKQEWWRKNTHSHSQADIELRPISRKNLSLQRKPGIFLQWKCIEWSKLSKLSSWPFI